MEKSNLQDSRARARAHKPATIQLFVSKIETDEADAYVTVLPGLKKGDAKVEVEEEKGLLHISGAYKDGLAERHSVFSRHLPLPKNAILDQVKADVINGLLRVTIPKAPAPEPEPEPKPKVIPIHICEN